MNLIQARKNPVKEENDLSQVNLESDGEKSLIGKKIKNNFYINQPCIILDPLYVLNTVLKS